jgi:3-dehydroquinate dehydratase
LTSNIHTSHDLNGPAAKRFRAKLANLNIPKIDLVEVFVDLLEAEILKSKTSLMNALPLCQLMSPMLFTLRSTNSWG